MTYLIHWEPWQHAAQVVLILAVAGPLAYYNIRKLFRK